MSQDTQGTAVATQPQPEPQASPQPAKPKRSQRKAAEQAPLHSNPRIAKAVAANDKDKFSSMEAWGKSHGLSKAERRQARQVLRDAGLGVGRGNRYANSTTAKVRAAAIRNQRAAKAQSRAANSAAKQEVDAS